MSRTAKRLAVAAIIGGAACIAYYFLANKETRNKISVPLKRNADRLRRTWGSITKGVYRSSDDKTAPSNINGDGSSASQIPFPESDSDDSIELCAEERISDCNPFGKESEDGAGKAEEKTLEDLQSGGTDPLEKETVEKTAETDLLEKDVGVSVAENELENNEAVEKTKSVAAQLDVTAKLYDIDAIESAVAQEESSSDDIPGLDIDKEVDRLFDGSGAERIDDGNECQYGNVSAASEGSAKKKEGQPASEKIDRQRWLNL